MGEQPAAQAQGTASAALDVKGLWVGYNHQPALDDVTFAVPAGSMVGIVGPNGAGKSTLFKAVLGLLRPWRGQIEVHGKPVGDGRRLIGYAPQLELVDWNFPVSVGDVVMMGRYPSPGLFRRPAGEDRDRVHQALERVGMLPLIKRQAGELSGGQRRRVLIARALARQPQMLLLDEPTAGLDAASQHELLVLLDGLRMEGKTIIFATHDLSCVASSCDLACCLNKRVVAYGPPRSVFTEEVLDATFESHLLLINIQGHLYASHNGERR